MFPLSSLLVIALELLTATQVSERRTIMNDYAGPPSRMSEAINQTALVIEGRVVGTEQRLLSNPQTALPMLLHRVSVIEVIKGPEFVKANDIIEVCQPGGVAVSNGVELRVSDSEFPPWHAGDRFILLLQRSASCGAWSTHYGPGGAYPVVSGRGGPDSVRIPTTAEHVDVLQGHHDMPKASFVGLIRSVGRGRY